MDILLQDRDHAAANGCLQTLTGPAEAIQRLLIRLSVRKGTFLPDPNLGSELYKLVPGPDADALALHFAQQALLPEHGAAVTGAACRLAAPDTLTVTVRIALHQTPYLLEVTP